MAVAPAPPFQTRSRSPSNASIAPSEDDRSYPSSASTPYADYAPGDPDEDGQSPLFSFTDVDLNPRTLDMEDDSEAARRMMAISALDSMKLGSPHPLSHSNTQSSSASASTSRTAFSSVVSSPATSLADLQGYPRLSANADQADGLVDEHFLERVSQMPIVSGAIKGYERARNSNRVVRYGADLVESGVKTISRPVIGRVINAEQLGHLDDFACRQLDRLGGPLSSSPVTTPNIPKVQPYEDDFARPDYMDELAANTEGIRRRRKNGKEPADEAELAATALLTGHLATAQNQVAPRSRWQSLVIEAGGLGAAVSEESMKSLQYCLEWLHYTSAHLDHEIVVLRDFIASLGHSANEGAVVNPSEAAATLTNIKREVVETIRRVVDVVSKYAGAALPEHAKRFVRASILSLPSKWKKSVSQRQPPTPVMENGAEGAEAMAIPSPGLIVGQTQEAAERVLAFAVESLDMLRGVTQIFGDSVEKAEAWLERLRLVGIAQQRERERRRLGETGLDEAEGDEGLDRARPRPRLEGPAPMEVDV